MILNLGQMDFADWWTFVVFPIFPLLCWLIFASLIWNRRRTLPLAERKEVPWGAIDVVFLLGTMLFAKFLGQLFAMVWISQTSGLPLDQINQEVALKNAGVLVSFGILFSILQLLFAGWYLRRYQGASWEDLGLNHDAWRRSICVGLVASLMVIPLVLFTNVLIHTILQIRYEHQVMTMIQYALIPAAISTVLVAPVVEEFHFRVVLQGFLQRLHDLDLPKKVKVIQGDKRAASYFSDHPLPESENDRMSVSCQKRIPFWPVLLSSFLFASVHAGQGAAPYALFVLSLFLGEVYRRTNSIIPCILIHLLLNLWSFTALVYSLD